MLKISENNGTEEFGLVTPTPDIALTHTVCFMPPCIEMGKMILKGYFDGLVQDCSNSSALAMELLQSCTKSSIRF